MKVFVFDNNCFVFQTDITLTLVDKGFMDRVIATVYATKLHSADNDKITCLNKQQLFEYMVVVDACV